MYTITNLFSTRGLDCAFHLPDYKRVSNLVFAENTVPVLRFNSTLTATDGEVVAFDLDGHDPDMNDVIKYYVIDNAGGAVTVNANTGAVSFTLDYDTPLSLK
jgi:hypothetical protein